MEPESVKLETQKEVEQSIKTEEKQNNKKIVIPKGLPKSGRLWKGGDAKKFSTLAREGSSQLKTTWEQKMKVRESRKRMKDIEKQVIEERKEAKREERRRREERLKRKQQNEARATQVQVLSDPSKLKSMSKKQLRMIRKSRVNASGEVEYVNLYSK